MVYGTFGPLKRQARHRLVTALLVLALGLGALGRPSGDAASRFLAWILLLPIGVTGLWAGIAHVAFPQVAAAHIAGADIVVGPVDVDVHRLSVNRRPFDRIVVAYGFAANLDVLDSLLRARVRTADGRVQVTPDQCCGPLRVFAAGDITDAMHPCSVTAMAQGIVAAKAIASRLSAESLTSRASAVA